MLNNSPLSTLIHEQAKVYGEKTALSYRDYATATWKNISWNEFSQKVSLVSNALIASGVAEQENVAVFTQNKPEGVCVDFGTYGIRAVSIPFYATSSEAQIQYMINDASVRFIFVGEQYQYDTAFRVLKMCPTLERLIIFDPTVVKNPQDRISLYFDEAK